MLGTSFSQECPHASMCTHVTSLLLCCATSLHAGSFPFRALEGSIPLLS